jgi:tRNA pseudouridine13 synthase
MLPYISNTNLKTGGVLKSSPSDFIVEEIPLYFPSGEGQHIYLLIEREGKSTKEVVDDLRVLFQIKETDIGYAGLKDKHAITIQWFSLSLGATASEDETSKKITDNLEYAKVLKSSKHTNKLKNSHLIGNKFKIILRDCDENCLEIALKIREELLQKGIPNYYGKQRFGSKEDNHITGKKVLLKEKVIKKHWMRKLMLSAYQSHLFNLWLSDRISTNRFNKIIPGDLLQGINQQRPFPYSPDKDHDKEFLNKEISFTGPIFGSKVSKPLEEALLIEESILTSEGVNLDTFKEMKLPGSRRLAHIFLKSLEIEENENNLTFEFTLSKGSYATSLLREFTKA